MLNAVGVHKTMALVVQSCRKYNYVHTNYRGGWCGTCPTSRCHWWDPSWSLAGGVISERGRPWKPSLVHHQRTCDVAVVKRCNFVFDSTVNYSRVLMQWTCSIAIPCMVLLGSQQCMDRMFVVRMIWKTRTRSRWHPIGSLVWSETMAEFSEGHSCYQ